MIYYVMKFVKRLEEVIAVFLAFTIFCTGQACASEPEFVGRGRIGPDEAYPICIKKGKDMLGEDAYIFSYFDSCVPEKYIRQLSEDTFIVYYFSEEKDSRTGQCDSIQNDIFRLTMIDAYGNAQIESYTYGCCVDLIKRISSKEHPLCVQFVSKDVHSDFCWRKSPAEVFPERDEHGRTIWGCDVFDRYMMGCARSHFSRRTLKYLKARDQKADRTYIDLSPNVPLGVVLCAFVLYDGLFSDESLSKEGDTCKKMRLL